MHARLFPRENKFVYGIYYIACPLDQLQNMDTGLFFRVNRPGLLSFYNRDHGDRQGGNLQTWINAILDQYGLGGIAPNVTLIAMPRVFGYVFNPVSFWLCHDMQGALRAVLCEVNNTFGERHSYLCAHADNHPIEEGDWLEGKKLFHVSPFLAREGVYKFRFNVQDRAFGVWIDFYDASGSKQLLTALTGTFAQFTPSAIRQRFFSHPLVTMTAIARIHWQALKLLAKGIRYIPKPVQMDQNLTVTENIKKM
ncbi:MAG: DUF1365 domain-containing protein [Proteobacteria bacterium]|nr:DUF1365 domain-containing protein [Pseudomonadota bacterium]